MEQLSEMVLPHILQHGIQYNVRQKLTDSLGLEKSTQPSNIWTAFLVNQQNIKLFKQTEPGIILASPDLQTIAIFNIISKKKKKERFRGFFMLCIIKTHPYNSHTSVLKYVLISSSIPFSFTKPLFSYQQSTNLNRIIPQFFGSSNYTPENPRDSKFPSEGILLRTGGEQQIKPFQHKFNLAKSRFYFFFPTPRVSSSHRKISRR